MAYYPPSNQVFWETPSSVFGEFRTEELKKEGKVVLSPQEVNHNLAFYSDHNKGAHRAFRRLCRTHAQPPQATGPQTIKSVEQMSAKDWAAFQLYIQKLDFDALAHFRYDPDEGWEGLTDHYKEIFRTGDEMPVTAATGVLEFTSNPANPATAKLVEEAFARMRSDGLGLYWAGGKVNDAGKTGKKRSETYGKGLITLLRNVIPVSTRVWKELDGCEEVEIIEEVMDQLDMKSEELTYNGGWQFFIRTDYDDIGGWNGR